MKRLVLAAVAALALAGCGPAPSPSTAPTPNVVCNELSFYVDPALASSYVCDTVLSNADPIAPHPAYSRVTLAGYPVSGAFWPATVSVISVADSTVVLPATSTMVTELQGLIGGAPVPAFTASFTNSVPFLPLNGAGEAFYAQTSVVAFTGGSGVRFLTEFSQYQVPVNNDELFYAYSGLTSDGAYWVTATLPVNLAGLPVDADTAMAGQTFEQWANGYEAYVVPAVATLDAAASTDYSPTLDALDALIASIVVAP